MKNLTLFFLLIIASFSTNAQGWAYSFPELYTTNSYTRVGVGTGADIEAKFHVAMADSCDTIPLVIFQHCDTADTDILQWKNGDDILGVISADGNVGIGTSTPQGLLDVMGGNTAVDALFIQSSPSTADQGGIIHHQSSTYAWEETAQATSSSTSGSLEFHYVNRTAPGTKQKANVFILRGDGRAAVGTNTLSDVFTANGDIASNYAGNFFNDGNNISRYGLKVSCGQDDQTATTNYYLRGYDGNGTEMGGLRVVSGTFATYNISDARFKTNIVNTKLNTNEIINKLRVVDYNWKENASGPVTHGFIAQEVQEVFPPMVSETPDGYLAISPTTLIPVMVHNMQQQNEKVTALEKQIAELKEQVAALVNLQGNSQTTGISNGEVTKVLLTNNPNPFKNNTSINYQIPSELNNAELVVYDPTGKEVHRQFVRGNGTVEFNAFDDAAGTYLCVIIADREIVQTMKMLFAK